MTQYVLVYVDSADYHTASVHGPFDSDDEARDYLASNFPTFTMDEQAPREEYEDGDEVVVLAALYHAGDPDNV